jgi:hypothetical protein
MIFIVARKLPKLVHLDVEFSLRDFCDRFAEGYFAKRFVLEQWRRK